MLRISTIKKVGLKLVTTSNHYGCLTNGNQKQLFLEPPTSQNPFKTRRLAKMIIKTPFYRLLSKAILLNFD
jgi:hypothetical protein